MVVYIPLLLFISVGWFLNDPVALLASAIFTICVFSYFALSNKIRLKLNLPIMFLGGISLFYFLSSLLNNVPLAVAWQGMYQRNFGIFFWLTIFCSVIILNSKINLGKKFVTNSLQPILLLSIFYGTLQYIDLDPFPWRNDLDAVQLSLGNPNFAAALYGMLVVLPVSKIIQAKSNSVRWREALVIASVVFLAIQTKSLQAFLVMLITISTYVLVFSYSFSKNQRKMIVKFFLFAGSAISVSITLVFLLNKAIFLRILTSLFYEGNVIQRLDYWRTSFRIFVQNPLVGVGPDQMQLYSAEIRTPSMVIRDGTYTLTDRAHNVLLDQLANGGLFAGLCWLSFTVLIIATAVKLIGRQRDKESLNVLAILFAIWMGYLSQGFLSPDSGMLAVLGFFSAGLILSAASQEKIGFKDFTISNKFQTALRVFSSIIVIISLVFWGRAIYADYSTKNVLRGNIVNKDKLLEIVDLWNNPRAAEQIAIYVARNNLDCEVINYSANKMLQVSERYSQAWYYKGYCANVVGDSASAITNIKKALKFDPVNPDYLMALTKIYLFSGNIVESTSWYEKLASNYPTYPELDKIRQELNR